MKKKLFFGIAAILVALLMMGCTDAGEPDDDDPLPGYTLTITDESENEIPANVQGASLLDSNMQPVATGVRTTGTKTFVFYHHLSNSLMPDFTKPYRTDGTYTIALAEVDFEHLTENPEVVYYYSTSAEFGASFNTDAFLEALATASLEDIDFEDEDSFENFFVPILTGLGQGAITVENTTTVTINSGTNTLAWGNFQKVTISEIVTEQAIEDALAELISNAFTLEVENITQGTEIYAAMLFNEDNTPVAIGIYNDDEGNFLFLSTSDGQTPKLQPFNTNGSYYVALVVIDDETPTLYFYTEDDAPATVGFPVDDPLDWDNFSEVTE